MRRNNPATTPGSAPLAALTVDQVGGPAQHTIEGSGGKVDWHRRRGAPGGVQTATFPPGTMLVTLGPQEQARYRISDAADRQWIRLPDGSLLLKYRRFERTYLTTVPRVNDYPLEAEIEFFHHRWSDYQQSVAVGGSDAHRDPPEVMREQLVRSAVRIAALLPYDEQLRLAERGRASAPPGSATAAFWQAVFDAYAAHTGDGDPLDRLLRGQGEPGGAPPPSLDASLARLLLESALLELRGHVPRLLYREHTRPVQAVAWSPDGKLIASAGDGGKVHLSTAKASALRIFPPWDNSIVDLCWSADGARIATLSADGVLRTWDVQTGCCQLTLDLAQPVRRAWWSPGGIRLAVSQRREGTLSIVEMESGQITLSLPSPDPEGGLWDWECSWSADGTRLAAAHAEGPVQVWELPSGLLRFHRQFPWPVLAAALAPGGTLLALAGEHEEEIGVWDIEAGAQSRSYRARAQRTHALAWSPDGMALASTSDEGTLLIWPAAGQDPEGACYCWPCALARPLFSPDSRRVATAAADGTVHVIEEGYAQQWRPRLVYLGHLGCRLPPRALAWSADSTALASSAWEPRRGAGAAAFHVWAPVHPTSPAR